MNQQFHSGNNGYDPINPNLFTPRPNGHATLSLIFGAIGIFLCSGLGLAFAITAIVLALSDRRKYGSFTTASRTGLILGIIGAVFGLASLIYNIVYLINGGFAEIVQTVKSSMNQ